MSQCEPPLGACAGRESHDETMTYVPRSTHNPSISLQDHDSCDEDTHMEDATAQSERKHVPKQSTSDQKDARAEARKSKPKQSTSDRKDSRAEVR